MANSFFQQYESILKIHCDWISSAGKSGQQADLSEKNLSGMALDAVYLPRANMSSVLMNGASLRGANLHESCLRSASMNGADLQGASLAGASLIGASMKGVDLQGATLKDASLCMASLRGAKLQGVNLVGASLRGVDLQGASLAGALLIGADLTNANLKGANLFGADLTSATLDCADLTNAILYGATLHNTSLEEYEEEPDRSLTIVAEFSTDIDGTQIVAPDDTWYAVVDQKVVFAERNTTGCFLNYAQLFQSLGITVYCMNVPHSSFRDPDGELSDEQMLEKALKQPGFLSNRKKLETVTP